MHSDNDNEGCLSDSQVRPNHPVRYPRGRGPAWRHADTITDLTIYLSSFSSSPPDPAEWPPAPRRGHWQIIAKDLYLGSGPEGKTAWLLVATVGDEVINKPWPMESDEDDLVVTDIRIADTAPAAGNDDPGNDGGWWEPRPCGLRVRQARRIIRRVSNEHRLVIGVDVLFGRDAVDPRPGWRLLKDTSIALPDARPDSEVPAPRLTFRRGPPLCTDDWQPELKADKKTGRFKIVQLADLHMGVGPGLCTDAMDTEGQPLPPLPADPRTVEFVSQVLDIEQPDLVVLTGDQLHHGILDSQTALFKVVAPMIARCIPFAAVFGNHDAEGPHALSRGEQMSILERLPFNLSESGDDDQEGVGNYHLRITGTSSPPTANGEFEQLRAILWFLDSHGELPQPAGKNPDYDPIQRRQIRAFQSYSTNIAESHAPYLQLAFFHIPLPEFADDSNLILVGGKRGEPTEGPSENTRFYDALARAGVVAVGCGHDHVNDFCALARRQELYSPRPSTPDSIVDDGGDLFRAKTEEEKQEEVEKEKEELRVDRGTGGPWLCYGGAAGFGAYGEYGGRRYHRRARVWELDTLNGGVKTWKRVEYRGRRVDEVVLVQGGVVWAPARRHIAQG